MANVRQRTPAARHLEANAARLAEAARDYRLACENNRWNEASQLLSHILGMATDAANMLGEYDAVVGREFRGIARTWAETMEQRYPDMVTQAGGEVLRVPDNITPTKGA